MLYIVVIYVYASQQSDDRNQLRILS